MMVWGWNQFVYVFYDILSIFNIFIKIHKWYTTANLHVYYLKGLLYGTEYGTGNENETLFLKIQDFLAKCGRFNPQS